jgi:beta-mannosidase
MHIQSLSGRWQFRKAGDSKWLKATVPGGAHTDLLALGRIPDPFFADNELKVQWVAESDWEYRRVFRVNAHTRDEVRPVDAGVHDDPRPSFADPQHREPTGATPLRRTLEDRRSEGKKFLVFDGLDTLAEVSLNGRLLGRADNQFRTWHWDVTRILAEGENELTVRFGSPLAFIRARQKERPLEAGGDIPGGPHLRKSPYHWGWDWGPKLPPVGIWKDVRLEEYSGARFADVHVRQEHSGDGRARVTVHAQQQGHGVAAPLLLCGLDSSLV